MVEIGVRDMRQHLSEYLEKVRQGQEVIITKRDEPIAKLVPIAKKSARPLASRSKLRELIAAKGKTLSQAVLEDRKERV